MKGTKVDGIYDQDPVKYPEAKRYETLTYQNAIEQQLKVMDTAAFSLCQENHIPIVVFNFFKPGELKRVIDGEHVGTLIQE
jgi:uridylate kinase